MGIARKKAKESRRSLWKPCFAQPVDKHESLPLSATSKPLIPARRRYDSVSGFPFPGTGPMFDLQIRLGNAQRIEAFLAELSAEGHWAAPDNGAIVRAAALLAAPRATELLVRIVRRNTTTHLSACDDLLLRCVAAPTGATGDLGQIGAALIEA